MLAVICCVALVTAKGVLLQEMAMMPRLAMKATSLSGAMSSMVVRLILTVGSMS